MDTTEQAALNMQGAALAFLAALYRAAGIGAVELLRDPNSYLRQLNVEGFDIPRFYDEAGAEVWAVFNAHFSDRGRSALDVLNKLQEEQNVIPQSADDLATLCVYAAFWLAAETFLNDPDAFDLEPIGGIGRVVFFFDSYEKAKERMRRLRIK